MLLVGLAVVADEPVDPPHGDLEIDCSACHTAEGWRPLRKPLQFKHRDVGLPLTGSHRKVACRSCHVSLVFAHVPTACSDCHRDVHRGEFGYGCERCHIPRSWDNRRRMWDRHAQTLFPLTGAHAIADCGSCHAENSPFQYALAPIECYDCHATQYEQTTNPDHQSNGFSTDCQLCHSTDSWDARGFPQHESLFPINSGAHRGAWSSCTDCHVNPGSFDTFECTTCHEHSRALMDDKHDEITGYVYESSACFACHPRGKE
jgi:hypothetical protein